MLGVLALVAKRQLAVLGGPLVRDYGGNVAASFAAFFVLKLPFVDARLRVAGAAALALVAATSFEFTDGFGFMSNTYDPGDCLANVVGVGLALAVEGIVARVIARTSAASPCVPQVDGRTMSAIPYPQGGRMAKARLATSGFLSLPSSRLGRVAGWLLLLGVILVVLNTAVILPFTESRSGLDAWQLAVNLLVGGCVVAAGACGLAAMIFRRDRSWTLVVSIVVLGLVVVMIVRDLIGSGP